MKETKHDYQNCYTGNPYDSKCNGEYQNWEDFKNNFAGFTDKNNFKEYDDTYHFIFRYDINKTKNGYELELCIMLQRKGIFLNIWIKDINDNIYNLEIKEWLEDRKKYINQLWNID